MVEHGTVTRYGYGCRCHDCRRAAAVDGRTRAQRAADRRVLIDGRLVAPAAPHGSRSTYKNNRCRCEPCTQANREGWAADKARRLAARQLIGGRLVAVTAARHGWASTYNNHGCRCQPCTDAGSADSAFTKAQRQKVTP